MPALDDSIQFVKGIGPNKAKLFEKLHIRTLRDALKRTCAGVTKLIVAQRIGTIRDADRIVVLEDGKVAGQGTHEELMRTCAVYREIASSQLSKEELA